MSVFGSLNQGLRAKRWCCSSGSKASHGNWPCGLRLVLMVVAMLAAAHVHIVAIMDIKRRMHCAGIKKQPDAVTLRDLVDQACMSSLEIVIDERCCLPKRTLAQVAVGDANAKHAKRLLNRLVVGQKHHDDGGWT